MEESGRNQNPQLDREPTDKPSEPMHLSIEKPSMKRLLMPIAIILVLIVAALLAIKSSVNKNAIHAGQNVLLTEGAEVPNLEFVDAAGKTTLLSDLNHKVILINFWATWCEACMIEMPSIVALREKYAPQGFEVIGINVDENPKEAIPATAKKFGMKFPSFTDADGKLSAVFDVHAIPLSVMINSDRKILYIESGERDWNDAEMNMMLEQWLGK